MSQSKAKYQLGTITKAEARKISAAYVKAQEPGNLSGNFYLNLDKVKRGTIVLTCTFDHEFKIAQVTSVARCPFTGDPKVRVRDNEYSWRISDCVLL